MKILLLGVGMQGKAALMDLAASEAVGEIVAADADHAGVERFIQRTSIGTRARAERLDAADPTSLNRLMEWDPDVVVDLLPPAFVGAVARAAVDAGVHLVNSCFVRPELEALGAAAEARGVILLPECGLDPGIDLLLLGDAVRTLEEVRGIRTYGAGIPEPGADDNPLRYKVTWSLEGVLGAYRRSARQVRGGRITDIQGDRLFAPDNVHDLEIEGLGRLEAYPNGDALPFAERLGLDPKELDHLGAYTMRWPGHCELWRKLVDLRFLDDEPVEVDGAFVDRRRFLARVLEPHLALGDDERDVVVLRVEVSGLRAGTEVTELRQLVAYRDLETGLTGMSRTVGAAASIGAQLLGSGAVAKTGLITPLTDLPTDHFIEELAARDIRVERQTIAS